jgi:hypothetical protein
MERVVAMASGERGDATAAARTPATRRPPAVRVSLSPFSPTKSRSPSRLPLCADPLRSIDLFLDVHAVSPAMMSGRKESD